MNDVGGTLKYVITADADEFFNSIRKIETAMSDMAAEGGKQGEKTGQGISQGVSDGAYNGLKAIRNFISNSASELSQFASSVGSVLTNAFVTASGIASTSLVSEIKGAIGDTQYLESATIQMQGLTHSLKEGNKAMGYATQYFKNNPFSRFDVVAATKTLVQYGAKVEEIPNLLTQMGNVSLTTGANINQLSMIYQRAVASGKVGLQDIYMLANNGADIWGAFERECGLSADAVRELTAAGGVSVEQFKKAFAGLVDEDAMKENEKTLARQLDRMKGRLSNLKMWLAGYELTPEGGFKLFDNSLYGQITKITKAFADSFDRAEGGGKKLYTAMSKLGSALSDILQRIFKFREVKEIVNGVEKTYLVSDRLDKILGGLGTVIDYISEHTQMLLPIILSALTLFGRLASGIPGVGNVISGITGPIKGLWKAFEGLSGPLKIVVGILGVGLFQGLKDGSLAEPLQKILDSVARIANALQPVVSRVLEIAGKIGESVVVPVIEALANVFELLATAIEAVPTPMLEAIVAAILGFMAFQKVSPVIEKATKVLGGFGKLPTNSLSSVGTTLGKFVGNIFASLGKMLPDIALGAAAVALIGLAIGAFIGSVGAGIWLFGKGLEAVGTGFKSLAEGIVQLNEVNADRLPEVIGSLAEALGGLFWQAFDFAVAAGTFEGIGRGLYAIAIGLQELRKVKTSDFEKLQPLAEGLRYFQISVTNLPFTTTINVLDTFKDLGDSLTYVIDMCNFVAEMKMDPEKLRNSLANLAMGLKAFTMEEFTPGFFTRVFSGDIKIKSVTDYMGTLGTVIEPIKGLQEIFNSYKFDAEQLKTNLKNLATGLKAFVVAEAQPSWIESVFGNVGSINYKSVTDYMGSLGNIIEPINKLSEMLKQSDFDHVEFTVFLGNLGESLKAFIICDITETMDGFWGLVSGSTKYESKSVLDYFGNFNNVIESLTKFQELAKDTDELKAEDFVKVLDSVADILNKFISRDIEYNYSMFLGRTENFKSTTRGILEYMDNFGSFVEGLGIMQENWKSMFTGKDAPDSEDFLEYMNAVGETLKAFTVVDYDDTYSEFMGKTVSMKGTYKTLLDSVSGLSELAEGLGKNLEVFTKFTADEKNKIDSTAFTDYLGRVAEVLQAMSYTDVYKESGGWGFYASSKEETKTLLDSLDGLVELGDGLAKISEIFEGEDKKLKPDEYVSFLNSLATMLSSTIYQSKKIREESSWFSSKSHSEEYDSIFEHLKDFQSFSEGIRGLLEIEDLKSTQVSDIKKFIASVTEVLRDTTFATSSEWANGKATSAFTSEAERSKYEYDSIFNRLNDFKSFADGVRSILEIKDLGSERIESVKKFITDLTTVLIDTTFLTSDESSTTIGDWGKSYEEKASKEYDSVFNHLSNFKDFADSLKPLLEIKEMGSETITALQGFIVDLANTLQTTTFKTSEETSSVIDEFMGEYKSDTYKLEQDSIYNHLSNFKDFTEGVSNILEIEGLDTTKIGLVKKFITDLTTVLNDTVKPFEEAGSNEENMFIISKKNEYSTKYDTILDHMGNFKEFADSIVPIMEACCRDNFDATVFDTTIKAVFGALNSLMLEESTTVEESSALFAGSSSTSTKAYASIVDKLGDLTAISNAINGFIDRGIGIKDSSIGDGLLFKTALTNIAFGLLSWSNLEDVYWEYIDVDVLNGIAEFVGKFKEQLGDWDTSKLPDKATEISTFLSTFVEAVKDTETVNSALENAKSLGQGIIDYIKNGFDDKKLELQGGLTELLNTVIPEAFKQSEDAIRGASRDDIVNVIANEIASENNTKTLQSTGYESLKTILKGLSENEAKVNDKTDAVVKQINSAWTNEINQQIYVGIGESIGAGIQQGLANKVSGINAVIGRISSSSVKTLKDLLGIHSPSRVMHGLGENIGEGLAEGIESQENRVIKAAQHLADAIEDPFRDLSVNANIASNTENYGSSQAGYGSKNITINQNNNINNGIDYATMMADLRWELFRA